MYDSISLFLDNQSSEKTSSTYKWALERWFAFLGENNTPDEQIALEFRKHLEETLSSRSAALVFNTIRVFYRFQGGYNPFERVKSPKRVVNATPKVPEDSTVDKMMDLCDNPREKAVLSLLANGLRASEVRNLPNDALWWSEDYERWILRVVGKGNKERLVPLGDEAAEALKEWLTENIGGEWLIPALDGNKMTLRAVEYIVEKYTRKIGQEFRPHRLRHNYATRLVRAGVDPFALQRLMGHQNIASTSIYTSLDLGDIVKAAERDIRNGTKD
jgi:site-specific recombinase XerD